MRHYYMYMYTIHSLLHIQVHVHYTHTVYVRVHYLCLGWYVFMTVLPISIVIKLLICDSAPGCKVQSVSTKAKLP